MSVYPAGTGPEDGTGVSSSSAAADDRLANRLAAVELRLRLMEAADPADRGESVPVDALLGLLRSTPLLEPATTTVDDSDPFDERAMARSGWAAEALQSLTELLARQRAALAITREELAAQTAALRAELIIARAVAARLEAGLERTYGQAQVVQDVVGALQASRSYRIGHRLARLAGRSGPTISPYETPIATGVQPRDVAIALASGVFDADWYLSTYPDVCEAGADPLTHFMTRARTEHRCPGPLFDTGWYLNEYGESVPADTNPLVHYLTTGWRQGWRPWETFDPEDYVRIHPEIAKLDICPLIYRAAMPADS